MLLVSPVGAAVLCGGSRTAPLQIAIVTPPAYSGSDPMLHHYRRRRRHLDRHLDRTCCVYKSQVITLDKVLIANAGRYQSCMVVEMKDDL